LQQVVHNESQIELNKVNHNLSEADYKTEQEGELKEKLIGSIVYIQPLRKNEKECAYFEYDDGNTKIKELLKPWTHISDITLP
jgi:hypothetical protein